MEPIAQSKPSTQRILVLSPHLVEWVAELGALDAVVAVIEGSDYPEKAKQIPVLGRHGFLSAQRLLSYEPTLVVAWEGGNRPELLHALRQFDVPIVAVRSRDLAEIPQEMEQVAQALGRAQAGAQLAQRFAERLQEMRLMYQESKKVSVFYEMSHTPMMTWSGEGLLQQILNVCGAQNVFQDVSLPYFQVGMKQVLERHPDVIVQPVGSRTEPFDWSSVTQEISMLRLDADQLHRPTMRLLDGIEQLCQGVARVR